MRFPRRLPVILLIAMLLLCPPSRAGATGEVVPPKLVAHAGGAVDGVTYSNSLEALNANYARGFRFFEVDFSWTADGQLVAVHDWESARDILNMPDDVGVPTKSQFLRMKTSTGLTTLSLEDVLAWAGGKGDAYVVTDIRDGNLDALRKIRDRYNAWQDRVIPQVYSYREYDDVSGLGYANIILTLYRMKVVPEDVLTFCRERRPFAVTMSLWLARSGLASQLHGQEIVVYAHTVNDPGLFAELAGEGVYGIYTDEIAPSSP